MPEKILRILLVDDESQVLQSIQSKIARLRHKRIYRITCATNATDALEIQSRDPHDAVLTDISMPAVNGLALVERLRSMDPHLPIFVISGYDHFDYVRKAFLLGVNDYLLKPIAISELDEKLRAIQGHCAAGQAEKGASYLIQATLRCMQEDPNCRITLKEIANQLNVNYSYLSELFRKEMHCGFSVFAQRMRMERARTLLSDPSLRVHEVALKLGYEDPSLFSRDYKRHFGVSPQKHRADGISHPSNS